jgi:hypothetical protein
MKSPSTWREFSWDSKLMTKGLSAESRPLANDRNSARSCDEHSPANPQSRGTKHRAWSR